MKTYHLQKFPDYFGTYNGRPVFAEGREFIAEEITATVMQAVDANSWIAAKKALEFPLTPLQEFRLSIEA